MRVLILAASLVAAFSLAGELAPEPVWDPTDMNVGPYAGALLQPGDTGSHHYQNAPTGATCITLAQPYTVTLEHVPVDSVLELRVGSHSTTVTGGVGQLTFWHGVCTAFTIEVELLDGGPTGYAVEVIGSQLAGDSIRDSVELT